MEIKSLIKQSVKRKILEKNIAFERKNEEYQVLKNFSKQYIEKMTDDEKSKVENLWNPVLTQIHAGAINVHSGGAAFTELGMFKHFRGFDARYLSHNAYLPIIAHLLNDYHYTKFFEDKNLLGTYIHSSLLVPRAYGHCINHELYDQDNKQVNLEQLVEKLKNVDTFILKDAVETSGGMGVEKLSRNHMDETSWSNTIKNALQRHSSNSIMQECIQQDKSMAIFNSDSVNTFRITTLYLHGRFSVCNIAFRTGKQGMKVDNWGAGGIMIGVSQNGDLNSVGYDIVLNEFHEYNGVCFKDIKFKKIPDILEQIQYCHEHEFSLCKLIGWDICLNSDGEPVLLEINSSQPGLIGEQLCCGPVFAERTEEVIEYCKKKDFCYNRALFKY